MNDTKHQISRTKEHISFNDQGSKRQFHDCSFGSCLRCGNGDFESDIRGIVHEGKNTGLLRIRSDRTQSAGLSRERCHDAGCGDHYSGARHPRTELVAGLSCHFTPGQLHQDLTKARVNYDLRIYIYHIKPIYKKKVIRELKSLGRKNVKILQEGKTYHF